MSLNFDQITLKFGVIVSKTENNSSNEIVNVITPNFDVITSNFDVITSNFDIFSSNFDAITPILM